jgi:hypothetical protein
MSVCAPSLCLSQRFEGIYAKSDSGLFDKNQTSKFQTNKRNVDIVSDVTYKNVKFNYKLVVLLAKYIEITILDKFVDLVIYISDLHICYPFFLRVHICYPCVT